MNAAEAGDVRLEEPDWRELFIASVARKDETYPIELREDDSFAEILWEYRRFHFTWLEDGKRLPMPAAQAIIGLAKLRIFPPRSRRKDIPHGGALFEEQHDNHCWLQIQQRAWRINAIEGGVLFLDSFGEEKQIGPFTREQWSKYVDKAADALNAAYPTI
jgi:hypothetical protein